MHFVGGGAGSSQMLWEARSPMTLRHWTCFSHTSSLNDMAQCDVFDWFFSLNETFAGLSGNPQFPRVLWSLESPERRPVSSGHGLGGAPRTPASGPQAGPGLVRSRVGSGNRAWCWSDITPAVQLVFSRKPLSLKTMASRLQRFLV